MGCVESEMLVLITELLAKLPGVGFWDWATAEMEAAIQSTETTDFLRCSDGAEPDDLRHNLAVARIDSSAETIAGTIDLLNIEHSCLLEGRKVRKLD